MLVPVAQATNEWFEALAHAVKVVRAERGRV